jgi:hypothetical protein
MGAKQVLFITAVVAASAAAAAMLTYRITSESKMPLVHELKQPLLLSGAGSPNTNYILPQGTSLYYDQAFPEGFVRYKVYINVEGVKLESREATEKFWLNPLSASPVDAAALRLLLREHPLTKQDLAAILKTSAISKDDIRELLTEYSK